MIGIIIFLSVSSPFFLFPRLHLIDKVHCQVFVPFKGQEPIPPRSSSLRHNPETAFVPVSIRQTSLSPQLHDRYYIIFSILSRNLHIFLKLYPNFSRPNPKSIRLPATGPSRIICSSGHFIVLTPDKRKAGVYLNNSSPNSAEKEGRIL